MTEPTHYILAVSAVELRIIDHALTMQGYLVTADEVRSGDTLRARVAQATPVEPVDVVTDTLDDDGAYWRRTENA